MAKKQEPGGTDPLDDLPPKPPRARNPKAKRRPGDNMEPDERRDAQAAFLLAFRDTAVVRYSAEAAGVSRQAVDYWRKHDKPFARRYEEAETDAADRIRQEVIRRAVEGVEEPLVSGGQLVYEQVPMLNKDGSPVEDKYGRPKYQRGPRVTVRKYSDTLMAHLAQWRLPEAKRERAGASVTVDTNADGSARVRAVFLMPEIEEPAE